MIAEQGVEVEHSTINRWVLQSALELDKRIRPHLHPTNDPRASCSDLDQIVGKSWVSRQNLFTGFTRS